MERNREARRASSVVAASSANRRPHVKDVSDEEERLDNLMDARSDPRVWERPKKEKLATFHISAASNPRNKRKRPILRYESQGMSRPGLTSEGADESMEETEGGASDDDDEPPPPLRKPVKARTPAKEDEVLRDIPAVPRKARSSISSSSRFSSIAKRQMEPPSGDIPQHKPPATSLKGTFSPGFLQKHLKKLKPVGTKVRPLKAPKISETPTISDQEVEVAEALFVLARSMPMHSRVTESKPEVKLEVEARADSPSAPMSSLAGPSSTSHLASNSPNGYVLSNLKDTPAPLVEAPKRKRPRVVIKQEDGRTSTQVRVVASSAVSSASIPPPGQVESEDPVSEKSQLQGTVVYGKLSAPSKVKAVTDAPASALSQEDGGERKVEVEPSDRESIEQGEFKAPSEEMECNSQACEEYSGQYKRERNPSTEDGVVGSDGLTKQDLVARSVDFRCCDNDRGTSKLNIDLMASPVKHSSHEEEGPGLATEKPVAEYDTSINSIGDNVEVGVQINSIGVNAEAHVEREPRALEVNKSLLTHKEQADEEARHSKPCIKPQQFVDRQQKDESAPGVLKEQKEDEDRVGQSVHHKVASRPLKSETDTGFDLSAVPVASTAGSSSAPSLAGWMGVPQLGYYAPGAAPWPAGTSFSNPTMDAKAIHAAMQLPHGALLAPVPRMKRCATHVYVAHFIYREQQLSRHSMWSAAICRAAPYNLNVPPPAGMIDNEKLGRFMEATRKASTQQPGPSYGHTVSQAVPGLAGSSSMHSGGPTGAISAPNHTSGVGAAADGGTGGGNASIMGVHNPYIQAMIQHNGFASFPFPFSGPPGQAAQFFSSPFFAPHMMPPLPHMQPNSNVLPMQKQQQGMGGSLPTQQQQQLQLQLAPQSPSLSQQQQQINHGGVAPQDYAEKESMGGSESLSTAESRLSSMQRTIGGHGPSSLPNLNMTPAMILGTNMGAMPSLDQDVSSATSGLKQAGKPQFQGQISAASLQQPFMTQAAGSAPGMQMKGFDPTLPQGYSALASNRLPGGRGTLGLTSVSSIVGTGLGGLPGSSDSNKGLVQQQPSYGGHSQQFQSSITKAPPASEDSYMPKARDYPEDKMSMRQAGVPPLLSRVEMEASSSSLQGSPMSGVPQGARPTSNLGRTLNTAPSPRSISSAGAGQASSMMQNHPPKQGMGRSKPGEGLNVAPSPVAQSMAAYAGRVLPGNLGKFAGTTLPFGQMAPTSQGAKSNPAGLVKVGGQRMSPGQQVQQQAPPPAMVVKGQVQPPAHNNQQGLHAHIQQQVPPPAMVVKGQVQPPRSNQQGGVPQLSTGNISMSTSHSQSAGPKGPSVPASKSMSNVKGTVPAVKMGPAGKKPSGSGPSMSSAMSPQSMSVRPPSQQKNQTVVHVSQFTQQQQSYAGTQQKMGAKNQAYAELQQQQGQYKPSFQQQPPMFQQQQVQYKPSFPQQLPPTFQQHRPQLFIQQKQQPNLNQFLPKEQALPQNLMVSPHHLAQTLPVQHGQTPSNLPTNPQHVQIQQQFQPAASLQAMATNNSMPLSSASMAVGTTGAGSMGISASLDGAMRPNPPPKVTYSSGNHPLPSAGMQEMMTSTHPPVGGQSSSPCSSSSHYVQLASPAKPLEQKSLHDSGNMEEMSSARYHPSTSSSQAGAPSNPTT